MKISDPRADWYIPRDWLAVLAINFGPILALLVMVVLVRPLWDTAHDDPTFLLEAMAIGCVGVVLLFIARLPLYRQRKYLSFGPRLLPAGHRKLYWISYGLIGTNVLIMMLLLIVLRSNEGIGTGINFAGIVGRIHMLSATGRKATSEDVL